MIRKLDLGILLLVVGGILIVAAVVAGLATLYAPTAARQKLSFHDSLARVADDARLARCAWIVSGDAQTSASDAMKILQRHDDQARSAGCDWYSAYPDFADGSVEWTRISESSVGLCTDMKPGPLPDRLTDEAPDYTFAEVNDAAVSADRHCYTIDLAAVQYSRFWGSVLPPDSR